MDRFYLALNLVCCLLLISCARVEDNSLNHAVEEEQTDLSCAYFYFLWGTHAEFNEIYPEAYEAYEKALICDPDAEYIREKIPVILLRMGEFAKAAEWLEQAIASHPDNSTYRLLLANLYIQQERVEEAIELYREVLKQEPDNEGVHLRLGFLYSHLEQYETAEKIFRNLLKNNSSSYFAHLSLARLLRQTNKYTEAIREYEAALDLNWSKELAFELGNLYSVQKRYPEALRTYTTITKNDQFDERAALSRVQTLLDLDRSEEALAELHRIQTHSPDPIRIDLIISKVLLRNERIDEARTILVRIADQTGNPEANYMLALLAYQEEAYSLALSHLERIQAEDEEFEELVFLQIRIYEKLGSIDEAIDLLEKHIDHEPSRSPLFYALLSSLYQEKNQDLRAIALMKEAIVLYNDNQQLFFEYGLLLEKNGRSDEAISTMQRVLELQPDHAEALNFIGYTWADRNIHLDKALEYISRAAELKPDNAYIIDSLGWVYYRLGQLDRAVQELKRSVELEPNDPHIYEHLGDVYRAMGNYPDALQSYKKAYEKFVDEDKKAAIQQKIDTLKN
ncbi:MAG: tetratricopeptide repeat protein [Desulforhopalus sp.]